MARRQERTEAGRRDKFITIEARDSEDQVDGEGAPTEEWETLIENMPASRTSPQGWERQQQVQPSARYDARWEIAFREDMDADAINVPKLRRIVYQNRVHDITFAAVIGRRAGVELFTIASMRIEE